MKQIITLGILGLMAIGCGQSNIDVPNDIEYKPLTSFLEEVKLELIPIIEASFDNRVNLKEIPIYVVSDKEFPVEKMKGLYYPDSQTILLKQTSGSTCNTMAHEYLHASLHQFNNDSDGNHIDPRFYQDGTISAWCTKVNEALTKKGLI